MDNKRDRDIEIIMLVTTILMLILIIIILFASSIFHSILKNVDITDILIITITFLGLFSTFFGALIGALLSGKYSLKIASDQRNLEKRHRINEYNSKYTLLKEDLKREIRLNRPKHLFGNEVLDGKFKPFDERYTRPIEKQIEEKHLGNMSFYRYKSIELKSSEGFNYIVSSKQGELDTLFRHLTSYLTLCEEINKNFLYSDTPLEINPIQREELQKNLQMIVDVIYKQKFGE